MDHEPFWNLVSERVREINDPGLSTGFVHRFRKCFPVAFDNINANLAVALAKKGNHGRASLQIQYMQETNQGLDDTAATLQLITKPLHTRIDHAIQQATGNLRDDPKDGANRAEQLLKVTEEPLKTLSTLLDSDNPEVEETIDEVVEACCNCAIAYGNATKDWQAGVRLLEKIFGMVVGAKLRFRILENLEIMRQNLEYARKQNIPPPVPSRYRRDYVGSRPVPKSSGTHAPPPVSPQYRKDYVGSRPSRPSSPGNSESAANGNSTTNGTGCILFTGCIAFAIVGFIIFLLAIERSNSSSSSSSQTVTPSSKQTYQPQSTPAPKPMYNTSSSYGPTYLSASARSLLEREIEDGKSRAKLLGTQIELKDAEIEGLERTMNNYRYSNTDEYNRLVPRFNSMVDDRNKIYQEYKQLIDSVNAKVKQYNASR